jgi:hypothetical protein
VATPGRQVPGLRTRLRRTWQDDKNTTQISISIAVLSVFELSNSGYDKITIVVASRAFHANHLPVKNHFIPVVTNK